MIQINIKEYRNNNNLTQQQLSDKSLISQAYLSKLESNNFRYKNNDKDKLIRIAQSLNVCPSKLLKFNCNKCAIKTTYKERKICRGNILDTCSDMFLLTKS